MPGRVGSTISMSGMVENVGVAVGIASPSGSVQTLFPLPVSWPTLRLSMSGNVSSVTFRSGMVENVGITYRIASLSLSVQKLFPLPVSTSGFVTDT